MTDDTKVLPFRPKLIDGGKQKKLEVENFDGLVVACHCGSTLHELRNGGVVVCTRCNCRAPIMWSWSNDSTPGRTDSPPPGEPA